ncbi:MAG: IS5 family transposase [Methylobacterium sp.]|jgi:putative transposase|uniref:IS5 family transposase n=1 Tax=Methylobacterium sp. TaxID=409 RepID=UPI0025F34873|nr:IS5 family transposase [Methylobacterium sp.]MBX9933697.1 IS5 family transposase [Methylobacterium sp.]
MNEARNSPYPSDLTNSEWLVLEPLMPPPATTGRPLKWTRRQMAEAIFYLLRSGCSWRMLPRHFPPWNTVHSQLLRWRDDGTLQRLHTALRDMTRTAAGRAEEPTAAIVDSQTARAAGCGGTERGYDGGKKTTGRKRHILVDTAGLLLLAHVHAANVHDTVGAREMVEAASPSALPRLDLVWADRAYVGPFSKWLKEKRGWRVEIPFHAARQVWRYGLEEKPKGFQVIPRRWVVERTFAWMSRSRRLARDYERNPSTVVAMMQLAMSRIMIRRLA